MMRGPAGVIYKHFEEVTDPRINRGTKRVNSTSSRAASPLCQAIAEGFILDVLNTYTTSD